MPNANPNPHAPSDAPAAPIAASITQPFTAPDLTTTLCGVRLKNPIIAASGTYGFGREYDALYDIAALGGLSTKGLTLLPRTGNAPHRIAETASGMLNSVGLQNPGVEAFLEADWPWLRAKDIVTIANIAGSTPDDYCRMAARIAQTDIPLVELNISCPNVKEGGVAFGTKPESVHAIVRAVKAAGRQPLIVKLSPNVRDIAEVACAAQDAGADAVSLINTLTGMVIDVRRRRPVLANVVGGLSGPAVMPVALRMVYEVARAVSVPVIGMGGIMTGEDAAAFLLAGATAVMVGTAHIVDPMAGPRIVRELSEEAQRQGVANIAELVGALRA